MQSFIVKGGKKLKGKIKVNSSKNATVALLAASLINQGRTTLKNVPQIEEVNRWIEVLESLGVKIEKKGRTLKIIPPQKLKTNQINRKSAQKTRSVILLVAALAGRNKKYTIPQAGGCKLGSRTIKPHLYALENFGINIQVTSNGYKVNSEKLHPTDKVVLYESGDTVTETTLMMASQVPFQTVIKMATSNYMVQDLIFFLKKLGVKIEGKGCDNLKITGKKSIKKNIEYTISEDPIEAMFFISLAIVTQSHLIIERCPIDFLELELLKLEKMGQKYNILKKYKSYNKQTNLVDLEIIPSKLVALEEKIHGLPFPGINMDNLPFFASIALKAKGKTFLHDWSYENRAVYLTELKRLGAKVTLLDPHRVYIEGPTKLKATTMISPPALRPAALILVAMLAAKGKSVLKDVYSINRGYEDLENRLKNIGAELEIKEV